MTPEETEKRIEFILQMQAQFESNQEKLGAKLEKQAEETDKLRLSIADTDRILRDSIQFSDQGFTRLEARLDERSTRLDQLYAELAIVHKEGEERLNSLINVVERHLTGSDHGLHPQ